MPSLIDLRRRVRATKSTQQITKAMKMVSSSKLRRAQERILRGRPYAQEMLRVFNNLATRTDNSTHPLLNDDPTAGRTLLIVITADRGLCGSFNTNVVKATAHFMNEMPKGSADKAIAMALIGRKGRDFFLRRGFDVKYEEVGLFQDVKWKHAQAIANTAIKEFLSPDISAVYMIYNEFKSVMAQNVVIEKLLPIPRLPASAEATAGKDSSAAYENIEYLFEPDPERLLSTLLPLHVATQVARALLESSAAEHAARMQSMDAATKNAKEMVERLTLYMNKVRQAAITREIIEVVSGAQAT
jgi:F-type H+-transporting ATPase subunit gamma